METPAVLRVFVLCGSAHLRGDGLPTTGSNGWGSWGEFQLVFPIPARNIIFFFFTGGADFPGHLILYGVLKVYQAWSQEIKKPRFFLF